MEKQESISTLYKKIQQQTRNLTGKLSFPQFQSIHKEFIQLSTLIENADLYSRNEQFKELSTSDILYLLVPYEHAKFIDSNAVSSQLGMDAEPMKRNKLRLLVLQIIESILWKFISLVVLDLKIFESLKNSLNDNNQIFENLYKWISFYGELRQIEITNDGPKGFVKLNQLEQKNFQNSGAIGRRDMKIGKWKLEKELNEKIKILKDEDIISNMDDEVVRKVRIDQIILAIIDVVGMLENICMEREMLSNIIGNSQNSEQWKIDGLQINDDKVGRNDDRQILNKESKFDKGYTDKLEFLDTKNKLISKEGKVLRPFTIVSSDQKKKELQSKVFGTGQVLPTMTVEELVDQELQNGGMVKPKEPEPEINEDDNEWQDKETYRLREWDRFTDVNKKGSGNKMGNLG
jgi:hypothetical protein